MLGSRLTTLLALAPLAALAAPHAQYAEGASQWKVAPAVELKLAAAGQQELLAALSAQAEAQGRARARAQAEAQANHVHDNTNSHSDNFVKVRRRAARHRHQARSGNGTKERKRVCAVKSTSSTLPSTPSSTSTSMSKSKSTAAPTSTSTVDEQSSTVAPSSSAAATSSASAAPEPSSSSTEEPASSSTTTSSSAAAASSSSASSSSVFPLSVANYWTTTVTDTGCLSYDGALKPLTAGKLPSQVTAPDGSDALEAAYPAGTVKYSASTGHGFSFYSEGAVNSVEVTGATEVVFSYSVYFSADFEFVKGGKLPGLYGGTSLETAKSCSGGRQDSRDTCFSARLMWRADGAGELYNYFPTSATQPDGYCSTAPKSYCDATYGDSIGRGSFYFKSGEWTTVTQRLKLNSPASAQNGEQELWVNGDKVLSLSGLQIRVSDDTKIYGIMAQTFFGGSDSSWQSPKDQWSYFKDFSLGVVST